MANIKETLTLEDKFSSTLTKFSQQLNKANSELIGLRNSTRQATTTLKAMASGFSEYANNQKKANAEKERGKQKTDALTNSVQRLFNAYVLFRGVKALVNMSDEYSATFARIKMINDGLQTANELNLAIFKSAITARGAYADTAQMVSKLGLLAPEAFSNSKEIVAFAEQINKQMIISGTNTAERRAAMLQLTQAMSAGVLRGDELRAVLEQTPMIAQSISKYMGVSTSEMRKLASEGLVTADIVKNAMFAAAEETNKKFKEMPWTWGQVFTVFKNYAMLAMRPILYIVSGLANNISIIGPLVLASAAAFGAYAVATGLVNGLAMAQRILAIQTAVVKVGSMALAGVMGILEAATLALTGQIGLASMALMTMPLTWIVAALALVVGALYAGVAAFNKFSGESVSATGIIVGAVYTIGAVFQNVFIFMHNILIGFENFLTNVFKNPVAAVKALFWDMCVTVLGYVSTIAHAIENVVNKIPGVNVSIASGLDKMVATAKKASADTKESAGLRNGAELIDYKSLGDAARNGYNKGKNLKNTLFGGAGGGYTTPALDNINNNLDGIGKNVGAIKKSVDMSKEDVKMLVDMATQKYVNKINLTSQTPVININGANTGDTEADRKALADTLKNILLEQAAAGSYRSTSMVF